MPAADHPQHLLDTHACLHLIRCGPAALRDLFDRCEPGDIAISSLTLAALRARANHSSAPEQNRRALDQFVLPLVVVDFDAAAAAWLAQLSTTAEQQGYRAGHEEMLAAQALSLNAQLITIRPTLYAAIPTLRLRAVEPQSEAPAEPINPRKSPLPVPSSVEPATGESAQSSAHQLSAESARPSNRRLPQSASGKSASTPPRDSLIRDSLNPIPDLRSAESVDSLLISGSHDFTLDLLAQRLHAANPGLTVAIVNAGSLGGLLALQQGQAHVAPAHLLDEETGDFNRGYIRHLLVPLGVRVVLLGFVERIQGLITRPGNPKHITALDDLARPNVTFVNRQRGSGTRILLDYHLRRTGLSPQRIRGYDHQEPTHLAVAAAVADGRADCGLGIFAAARTLSLDFTPLFAERFDLVIPIEHYHSALLAPLLAELRQPNAGFMRQVEALGGYTTVHMGEVLAEL